MCQAPWRLHDFAAAAWRPSPKRHTLRSHKQPGHRRRTAIATALAQRYACNSKIRNWLGDCDENRPVEIRWPCPGRIVGRAGRRCGFQLGHRGAERAVGTNPPIWTVPEIGALPNDDLGRLIRRGPRSDHRDLCAYRSGGRRSRQALCRQQSGLHQLPPAWRGPRSSGSRSTAFTAIFRPTASASGTEISLEDRLNSCMTRSMNGRPIPNDAPEMKALVAYIKFLSTGVPPGEKLPGLGTGTMPELNRAADPVRGQDGLRQHLRGVSRPRRPRAFAAACRPPISAT